MPSATNTRSLASGGCTSKGQHTVHCLNRATYYRDEVLIKSNSRFRSSLRNPNSRGLLRAGTASHRISAGTPTWRRVDPLSCGSSPSLKFPGGRKPSLADLFLFTPAIVRQDGEAKRIVTPLGTHLPRRSRLDVLRARRREKGHSHLPTGADGGTAARCPARRRRTAGLGSCQCAQLSRFLCYRGSVKCL